MTFEIGQSVIDRVNGEEWKIVDVDEGGKFIIRRPDKEWGSVTAIAKADELAPKEESR